jgi:hypothetical protein
VNHLAVDKPQAIPSLLFATPDHPAHVGLAHGEHSADVPLGERPGPGPAEIKRLATNQAKQAQLLVRKVVPVSQLHEIPKRSLAFRWGEGLDFSHAHPRVGGLAKSNNLCLLLHCSSAGLGESNLARPGQSALRPFCFFGIVCSFDLLHPILLGPAASQPFLDDFDDVLALGVGDVVATVGVALAGNSVMGYFDFQSS